MWIGVLIPALLSIGAVALSVRASRHRRFLHDMPTSPTAGVFIGDVEVKGRVVSEEPLVSYLSETRCIHHAWTITEDWGRWVTETYRDEKGNTRTRQRWETGSMLVASGGERIPFHIEDETGVLLVHPDGASLEASATVRFACGPDHPSYYGKGPAGAVRDSLHRRNFHEDAIAVDARVFIVGRARERSDIVAAEIAAHADARMFLISVRDEKAVAGGYGISSWVWGIAGLLCWGIAAAVLARGLMGRSGDLHPLVIAAGFCSYAIPLALSWAWMAFNSIVSLRQRVRRAWSNIDVELRRRADLLPNLAEVVRAMRMHDRDTQQVIAILRAQAAIAPDEARGGEARVRGMAPVLAAIAEAYPAISAQPNFLALQRELVNTESRIALARTYYNGIATAFNARLLVIPDRFLAAIARLKPFDLFKATDLEREMPRASFDNP